MRIQWYVPLNFYRIGLTLYKLESIMQGDIEDIIEELATFYQAQAMQSEETAEIS